MNEKFAEIPSVLTINKAKSQATNVDFSKTFINPNDVILLTYNNQINKQLGNAIKFNIPSNNQIFKLELLEATDLYDYTIELSDGTIKTADKSIRHYRGIVNNDSMSIAAITFTDNEIIGLLFTNEGNFNLVLDKKSGQYLFFNDKNIIKKPDIQCYTKDDYSFYDPETLEGKLALRTTYNQNVKFVKLCYETEFDIYQYYGSVNAVESYITALHNQVALLFSNDGVYTKLSHMYIWNTNDPYTGSDSKTLLPQFQNYRTTINGDLCQLLTFRSLGGGRSALINGLCNNSTSNKLAVVNIYPNIVNIPTYSWSVFSVTHEFGHLLGSQHTHACVWNGNNTAIDGCFWDSINTCVRPSSPPGGGTIMSYCHLSSVGINFNNGFGPQPSNVIRNNITNSSCLSSYYITGSDHICTSGIFSVANTTSNSNVTWSRYPTSLSLFSNGNSCTISGSYNGEAWIEATIDNIVSVRKYFVKGNPVPSSVSTFHETSSGTAYGWCSNQAGNKIRLEFGSPSGNSNLYWPLSYDVRIVRWNTNTVVANLGTVYGELDIDVNYTPSPSQNGWYEIQVRPKSCGTGSWYPIQEVEISDCSLPHYMVYPNPGENTIYLSKSIDNEGISKTTKVNLNIKISSITSGFVKDINIETLGEQIDISTLPNGIYILSIYENNQFIESLKIVVKK